jgi:hypothetical protein
MNRHFRAAALAVAAITVFAFTGTAQQIDPSYEVSLQLIVGSSDSTKGDLPANLATISRQLRSSFNFSNYRLAGTYLGRASNNGAVEYKSQSNLFGPDSDSRPQPLPIFMEWSLSDLRSGPTAKGPAGFQARSFRFGARVPVTTQTVVESKSHPVTQYEPIGLSLGRFGLPENVPTLVGTLGLPGTSGMVFLVMTVRPTDT